jgi:ATP/maltotriose-dependent transcriptional regulator MalT
MQLAIFRGDFISAAARLQEIEALLSEKDYGVRYIMYDIACGLYLMTLGRHEYIPEWLKGGFATYKHPSFIENYANRVKTIYHYRTQQYTALLAFIDSEMEQTVMFGKIGLKVMQALSLYQLKKHREAIAALTEAYNLAAPNRLTVLFTQFSKDMRTLCDAALKDNSCTIPHDWLEEVSRKSATYAKRQAHVIGEYKKANNIAEAIVFSPRESEILTDISQGFSRSEIAANRKLSIKTVKMVIANIYDKAGTENLSDLVRIAVDRKMV